MNLNNGTVIVSTNIARSGNNRVNSIKWYDNEWGYSNRVVDLTAFVGKKLASGKKAVAAAH